MTTTTMTTTTTTTMHTTITHKKRLHATPMWTSMDHSPHSPTCMLRVGCMSIHFVLVVVFIMDGILIHFNCVFICKSLLVLHPMLSIGFESSILWFGVFEICYNLIKCTGFVHYIQYIRQLSCSFKFFL